MTVIKYYFNGIPPTTPNLYVICQHLYCSVIRRVTHPLLSGMLLDDANNISCTIIILVSGEGGASKEHKTSLHAIRSIIRNEGFTGIYSG